MRRSYKVACLAGDGHGPELMAQATRALRKVARMHGFAIEDVHVPFGSEALTRFGGGSGNGGFLFGDFSAADIMYAPVTTRFTTYSLPVPDFAADYCRRVQAQPFVKEWIDAAHQESWVIEKFEQPE